MNRRKFLKTSCASCVVMCGALPMVKWNNLIFAADNSFEARYYEKLAQRKIRCKLCPRECVIDDLERGYCGVRENRGGTYYSLVYGKPCSANVDPIEKKPLFHFLPGSQSFSIATAGCNVMCKFCQNWEISQSQPEQIRSVDMPPKSVAEIAARNRCASIAYTYSEPVVFAEYMYDTAAAGHEKRIKSVMISNGYINPKPMQDLCQVLDAVKIDLKAFTEKFYRELVSGELRPVLDTLVLLRKQNMWIEIVYLVIPGQNDAAGELSEMCRWIVTELGPDTPVHFTRFYPQYRLTNLPATPIPTLKKARQIGLDSGLRFVYTGNIPGDPGENTCCPSCGAVLIRRLGFNVIENALQNNKCSRCQLPIPGVWS